MTQSRSWNVGDIIRAPAYSGGHCVCHVRPMLDGGKIVSMYANSWGTDFGATHEIAGGVKTRGFGYDSRAKISTMVSRGAWAIRTVIRPSWMV